MSHTESGSNRHWTKPASCEVASAFQALTQNLKPAGLEAVRYKYAMTFLTSGICFFWVVLLFSQINYSYRLIGFILATGGLIILTWLGIRQLILSRINRIYPHVESMMASIHLQNEKLLAIAIAINTNGAILPTRLKNQCVIALTTHRVLIIPTKDEPCTMDKATEKPMGNKAFTIYDSANHQNMYCKRILFPLGLNLIARKIIIMPAGIDNNVSLIAFIRFGNNARIIKSVLKKRQRDMVSLDPAQI